MARVHRRRDTFVDNFTRRRELGAACCAFQSGKKVVDLWGGALGFADPATGVGYAYVTNRIWTRLTGDLRDVALRGALSAAVSTSSGVTGRRVA